MRALTYNVNISNALQTLVLTAAIDEMAKSTLSWSAINEAQSFILQRKNSYQTEFSTIATLPSDVQTYQDDVRTESGKITYRIKASRKLSESGDYDYSYKQAPVVPGVSKEEGELFAIYPNPAGKNEKITVKF